MGSAGSEGPTVAFRVIIEHSHDAPSVAEVVEALQATAKAMYIEVHEAGDPCEEVGHLLGDECQRCKFNRETTGVQESASASTAKADVEAEGQRLREELSAPIASNEVLLARLREVEARIKQGERMTTCYECDSTWSTTPASAEDGICPDCGSVSSRIHNIPMLEECQACGIKEKPQ